MTIRLSPLLNDRLLETARDIINDGILNPNAYLEIYTAPKPSSTISAPTGVKLTTFYLPDPATSGPLNGELTVLLSGLTAIITADGQASWFRLYNKDGTTMYDGDVTLLGDSKGDIQLETLDFQNGKNLQVANGRLRFNCPQT